LAFIIGIDIFVLTPFRGKTSFEPLIGKACGERERLTVQTIDTSDLARETEVKVTRIPIYTISVGQTI